MHLSNILEWDKKYLLTINNYENKFLSIFMKIITFLGRETIYFTLIAFYIFVYYWRAGFIAVGSCLLYGLGICYTLKVIIDRKRPYNDEKIRIKIKLRDRKGSSSSFPSWHSYNVTSQVFIFYFIFDNYFILIIGLVLAGLVAISRIYLGLHFPSDCIAGYLLGILGFLISFFTFNSWYSLVLLVEQMAGFGLQPDQVINSFFRFSWYYIIVIIVFFGIGFASVFKYFFRKKEK
ncbi:MAG: phosphatase PAP2 family protein [Candidatus Lokiarchaeota archaeon]|nr:phosphatase PAP2 family protein [Candidatus Lokiarchaeota archaeon]